MNKIKIIQSECYNDDRGKLISFNTFDMSIIKRFYEISPADTQIVRAWQGHKIENKWFYCSKGEFKINLIKLDNFENPSKEQQVEEYILKSEQPKILHIPGGYLNGFVALKKNSKLIIFSDVYLNSSKNDDFRFDKNNWVNW